MDRPKLIMKNNSLTSTGKFTSSTPLQNGAHNQPLGPRISPLPPPKPPHLQLTDTGSESINEGWERGCEGEGRRMGVAGKERGEFNFEGEA